MAFLRRQEGVNHLLIGILDAAPPGLYMATVRSGVRMSAVGLRTPGRRLLLAATGTRSAVERLAAVVASEEPDIPGVQGPLPAVDQFAAAWRRGGGGAAVRERSLRIHEVDESLLRDPGAPLAPGHLAPAAASEASLFGEWLVAFEREALEDRGTGVAAATATIRANLDAGTLFCWRDGRTVAMAARVPSGPGLARVNMVYTPPAQRGRGYAAALVEGLSRAGLQAGLRRLFLYTDLANPISNRLYRRLGYRPVADAAEYRFEQHSG